MKKISLILIILVLSSSVFIVEAQRRGRIFRQGNERRVQTVEKKGEFKVDGRDRTYLVHLPKGYKRGTKVPLVLAFHGGGGNAQNMIKMSGFNEKADRENFIVVYPNGSGKLDNMLLTFNAIGCCSYAMTNNIDDVKFVSQLIDKLVVDYNIDKNRVYVTGFSNGALISNLVAAKLSSKIAASAPVSGSLFASSPKPVGKVPVLMIHGTKDEAVPYEGGESRSKLVATNMSENYRSVKDSAAYWAANSGCKPVPKKTTRDNVSVEKFIDCEGGNDVEVITIIGGGHSWPGGQPGRRSGDKPSDQLNATDAIWNFFKRHHK